MFPKEIKTFVKDLNYKLDTIGRSEDRVYLFEERYVLKVSKNIDLLKREKDIVDFLKENNIPGSTSVCFIKDNNYAYYLRTYLKGHSLIAPHIINNPLLLIEILSNVINILKSLDNKCKIKSLESNGIEFIHGDLCLPNILVDEYNNFIGFIDLGNAGVGDRWYDYSWLLWSLEYNLKTTKYHDLLLKKLNITFNQDKYNQYIPIEYR